MKVKLTKNSLREQQLRLLQLEKYLPTLRLKKALLQTEINYTKAHIEKYTEELIRTKKKVLAFSDLLVERYGESFLSYIDVIELKKHYENIAGVDIPIFESVEFLQEDYSCFSTPSWLDSALFYLKEMVHWREKITVEKEKKQALEKELKDVAIRVNLFEKILIPRAIKNIKKIKIFLGDQELALVSQAKVAKTKILLKKAYR